MALKFGTNKSEKIGGTPYDDTIFALEGDDSVLGFWGNDQLIGGSGNDYLIGGPGADFLDGGPDSGPSTYQDTDVKGDTAGYSDSPAGVTVNLESGTGSGGDAEGDTLQNIEHLIGSNWKDSLTGNDGANQLEGLAGNDTLKGGGGSDHLDGGGDDDLLYGGDGDDLLHGGGDDDRLYGEEGDDHLLGSDGNDKLYGNGDDDYLSGGYGNDYLSGGASDDRLEGDWGKDTLLGGSGEDTFVITKVSDYQEGGEIIHLTHSGLSNPDHILDFDTTDDSIDMEAVIWPVSGPSTFAGTSAGAATNYVEGAIGYNAGYLAARNLAEDQPVRYVFLTDGVNGYLFGDIDGDAWIETGIVLEGLTSINDFHYWDII